ncbi:MAG: DUF3108 domain-containing protein [Planctomycetes bacterium]|nr:DUF3108 domain-containing protein [Planctomycetota bacterium]
MAANPASGALESSGATPTPAVATIAPPVGELLKYRATVSKAGISMDAGTAEFQTSLDGDGRVVLTANARGEKFGYELAMTLRSVLANGGKRPELYHYLQEGSEYREKKLIFSERGIEYWRLKHCNGAQCSDATHEVSKTRWVGAVIPWGSHEVHCTDKHCGDTQHLVWRLRSRILRDEPCFDMLSAVYAARALIESPDAAEPGRPREIAVINDHDLWRVKLLVKGEETCTVGAGTFNAIEVALEPTPTGDGKVREEFRGLFGLHGTIRIWVDRESKRPILVKGTLPFGPMDLNATAELIEIGAVEPSIAQTGAHGSEHKEKP